jgi:hypothetical protein
MMAPRVSRGAYSTPLGERKFFYRSDSLGAGKNLFLEDKMGCVGVKGISRGEDDFEDCSLRMFAGGRGGCGFGAGKLLR